MAHALTLAFAVIALDQPGAPLRALQSGRQGRSRGTRAALCSRALPRRRPGMSVAPRQVLNACVASKSPHWDEAERLLQRQQG